MCLEEEADMHREQEYLRRMATVFNANTTVFGEIWMPLYSAHHDTAVVSTLVDRYTQEMKVVVRRVLDVLQADENIGRVDFPVVKAQFGGVGQYLLDKGE